MGHGKVLVELGISGIDLAPHAVSLAGAVGIMQLMQGPYAGMTLMLGLLLGSQGKRPLSQPSHDYPGLDRHAGGGSQA